MTTKVSPQKFKSIITVINPLVENYRDVECRICYDSSDMLIKVCACSGSIEYVHLKCIEIWINNFPKNHPKHYSCEICKQPYFLDYKSLKNTLEDSNVKSMSINFLILFTLLFISGFITIIILITN
tara:strand:- start:4069 stop:4446 length:378 start_codon:yes stop_codon:yes gene_type:complete